MHHKICHKLETNYQGVIQDCLKVKNDIMGELLAVRFRQAKHIEPRIIKEIEDLADSIMVSIYVKDGWLTMLFRPESD